MARKAAEYRLNIRPTVGSWPPTRHKQHEDDHASRAASATPITPPPLARVVEQPPRSPPSRGEACRRPRKNHRSAPNPGRPLTAVHKGAPIRAQSMTHVSSQPPRHFQRVLRGVVPLGPRVRTGPAHTNPARIKLRVPDSRRRGCGSKPRALAKPPALACFASGMGRVPAREWRPPISRPPPTQTVVHDHRRGLNESSLAFVL